MSKVLQKYFSAVKKIIPEKSLLPTVGLDVGTYSCKAVALRKDGNRYTLTGWGRQRVESGDQKQAIRDVLAQLGSLSSAPFCAVSGKGSLIRYIDLPKMSLSDLKKSFAIEVDKYFPFPVEQIYTDCCILDSSRKDGKMSVLVAAAKKDMVDSRLSLLAELGWQTDFISLNAIALNNRTNSPSPPPSGFPY